MLPVRCCWSLVSCLFKGSLDGLEAYLALIAMDQNGMVNPCDQNLQNPDNDSIRGFHSRIFVWMHQDPMVGYASFFEKSLMIRRIGFFNEGPIIASMVSKISQEYTGEEKSHTYTMVFRPSLFIAGRLRSCGNALLYIPFVTSAKLTGSSDAGGSFSKDGL